MTETNQEFKLAAHAWIQKDNKFLVTRRSITDSFMPLTWDTPGGSLDFGEDPIDAVIRETKEEAGLDIKVGKLIHCHNQYYSNTGHHWFALVYQCEVIGDSTVNIDPGEHDEFRWVTIDELKTLPKIDFLNDFYQNFLQKKS